MNCNHDHACYMMGYVIGLRDAQVADPDFTRLFMAKLRETMDSSEFNPPRSKSS